MGGSVSFEATKWAWKAPVKKSSQRLVLLALADRAGKDRTMWPTIECIAEDTNLNEKTVQSVLGQLMKMGLVKDTNKRKGPTKRTKVLKLIFTVEKKESTQKRDDSIDQACAQTGSNQPDIGGIKSTQKRDDLPQENPLECGDSTGKAHNVQNHSASLSLKLTGEHEWVPDIEQLATKLKMAGHENNVDLIIGLPRFEFELSSFNSHFDSQVLSDSKKLHKFTAWIIDKFERHQKQNPDYGVRSLEAAEQHSLAAPVFNLPDKPKGFLGGLE